jgi:ribonuclease BN (tRNA processing enzyme)
VAGLSFIPLGVGDAFSARWYSSCLLLEADGARLLVDCPHPIRKMLRDAGAVDLDGVDAVALTHLHADHSSGLESLGFYAFYVLGRRAQILTHPRVAEKLWSGHLAGSMEESLRPGATEPERRTLEDFFEVHALDEAAAVTFGPFEIECRFTAHSIPTTALRIRAGGRCLGYSADTGWDEGLIAWLSEADLIVHETNVGVHTPYEKLAALPAPLRRRMRLIHYPDDFALDASAIEPLRTGERQVV